MPLIGDWNLEEIRGCNLPQKVQSDFIAVTSELVDANYEPICYLGSQQVNGVNYRVLALYKPVSTAGKKRIVVMIIHEELDGSASLSEVRDVEL